MEAPEPINSILNSLKKNRDIAYLNLISNNVQDVNSNIEKMKSFNSARLLLDFYTTMENIIRLDIPNLDLGLILHHETDKYNNLLFKIHQLFLEYDNSNRYYHNSFHIVRCLEVLSNNFSNLLKNHSFTELLLVKVALMFHDIAYEINHKKYNKDNSATISNEEHSARIFEMVVNELLETMSDYYDLTSTRININIIKELICCTDHKEFFTYDLYNGNNASIKGLVCDIDLSILGSDPVTFQNYRLAVRNEYSHVTDSEWDEGSKVFANHFLNNRDFIFSSPTMYSYEKQARNNLTAILENKNDNE